MVPIFEEFSLNKRESFLVLASRSYPSPEESG
jgi:hypothetical protein